MGKLLKIDRDSMFPLEKINFERQYPEKISDYQADMMLHALGADYSPYKSYRGNKQFYATRNYYDAGVRDVELWDDLVSKGYAEKHTFYGVTVKGIRVLEHLTQCRIWDDYQNVADCRNAVLIELMKHDVSCGYGNWLPLSSIDLSAALAIPQKLILQTLKKLAEERLVKKGHYGEMDSDGAVSCVHGWFITTEAIEKYAEKYEELKKEEYKHIDELLHAEDGE